MNLEKRITQTVICGMIRVVLLCLPLSGSIAQELYKPLNIQKAIENGTRSEDGAPGPNYWQNRASYDMKVSLEPHTGTITGSEKIKYTNNSPDTLKQIVIALYADIFNKANNRDWNIPQQALNEGVSISKLVVDNNSIDLAGKMVQRIGTNLIFSPAKYVLPNSVVNLEIDWSFSYPKGITIRNGDYRDSTFFVSYFYPKVAVYDDIDGWDRVNYTGQVEFYADFSDYEVEVTVPAEFVVWATGILQNPDEVLNNKYVKRLKKASKAKRTVHIIPYSEAGQPGITKSPEKNAWKYSAKNVPDFAFGTSDKFMWDAKRAKLNENGDKTAVVHAAYRMDSEDYREVTDLATMSLFDYSTKLPGVIYPYPQMTIFNGNSGMEFPMMCNNASYKNNRMGTITLVYHEVAHSWFPFHVGVNERKYAFMDEGWANLFPTYYLHQYEKEYFQSRKDRYYGFAGQEYEQSMMTPSNLLSVRGAYRQNSYNKSYWAYYYLIDLLGRDDFLRVFQSYINTWAGKHPIPYDFYNTFNELSGKNLNWYWKAWFFDRGYADLAISGVENGQLVIENPGGLPLPIHVTMDYGDGIPVDVSLGIEAWKKGGQVLIPIPKGKTLTKAVLGADHIIDADESNNVWEK
jgi:hypothetical protein